jgi:hypothetical protein
MPKGSGIRRKTHGGGQSLRRADNNVRRATPPVARFGASGLYLPGIGAESFRPTRMRGAICVERFRLSGDDSSETARSRRDSSVLFAGKTEMQEIVASNFLC